jgi:hypothetical protein
VLNAGPDSLTAAREPLTEIARDVARLAHCAGAFSVTGATIRTEAIWAAEEVIESIQTYLVGFTRSSAAGTSGDTKTLMLRVGTIHSVIDRVKGSLSADNRTAVVKRWQSDASHLDDAVREIKDMIEDAENDEGAEKDDFDDGWGEIMDGPGGKLAPNEVEAAKKVCFRGFLSRQLIWFAFKQTMMVLRMAALLHKRILSRLVLPSAGNDQTSIDLENLLALSASLSTGSDDMAESLWSPQDPGQVASRAREVQKRVHTLREPLVSSGLLPPEPPAEGIPASQTSNKDAEWFKMCFDQIDKAVRNITVNS